MLEVVRQNPEAYTGGTLQMVNEELGLKGTFAEYIGTIIKIFEEGEVLWINLEEVYKRYLWPNPNRFGEWNHHMSEEWYPIELNVIGSDAIHLGGGVYSFRADNAEHVAVGKIYPPGFPLQETDPNDLLNL